MVIYREGSPWTEIWTTNEEPASTPELSVEVLEKLVRRVKSMPNPIRPIRSDDGRSFYFAWTTRERMIQNLPVGWTFRAVPFSRRGCFCLYEPVPMELLDRKLESGYGYYHG